MHHRTEEIVEMVFALASVLIVLALTLFVAPIFVNIGAAMDSAGFGIWSKILLYSAMVVIWFVVAFMILTTGFSLSQEMCEFINNRNILPNEYALDEYGNAIVVRNGVQRNNKNI